MTVLNYVEKVMKDSLLPCAGFSLQWLLLASSLVEHRL